MVSCFSATRGSRCGMTSADTPSSSRCVLPARKPSDTSASAIVRRSPRGRQERSGGRSPTQNRSPTPRRPLRYAKVLRVRAPRRSSAGSPRGGGAPRANAIAERPERPGGRGYGSPVAVVLVTGMSGTGKSAALASSAAEATASWTPTTAAGSSTSRPRTGARVSHCGGNSSSTASSTTTATARCSSRAASRTREVLPARFDAVVLLSAPAEVVLDRVATRRANDFGKTEAQRRWILEDLAAVEPLLRAGDSRDRHQGAARRGGRLARAHRPRR